MELGPLGASRRCRGAVGVVYGIGSRSVIMDVDELEDEGTTGADAAASGEKVSTDDIFEDGRFTSGLRTNNDLGIMLAMPDGR